MSLTRSLLSIVRKMDATGDRTASAVQYLKDFTQRPEIVEEFRRSTEEEVLAHAVTLGRPPPSEIPTAPPAPEDTE